MEPINYLGMMPNIDLGKSLLTGLQTGISLRNIQQQQEERALAMQKQQAALDRQNQYAIDLQRAHTLRTPEAFAELTTAYPEQREAFKQSWDMLSADQKKHEYSQGVQVHMALQSKNIPVAKKILETNIQALESSGQDAGGLKQIAEAIETDPESAYTLTGLYLSSVDPDQWGKVVENYTKQKKSPFEIREAEAKAGKEESEQIIKGIQAEQAPILEASKTKEQVAKTTTAESEALYSEKKQKLTVAKLGAEIGLTNAQIAEAQAKAAKARTEGAAAAGFILPPDKRFDMTKKLRDEYLRETKPFWEVKDAYNRVVAAQNTGVGDIALIFGYMKMLDPGSVVREGEFATASNSGGVPATIQNLYNKALNGERLTSGQRKTFVGQAKKLYENAGIREREVRKGIQNVASPYGIREEEVFYTKSPVPGKQDKAKERKSMSSKDIAKKLGDI